MQFTPKEAKQENSEQKLSDLSIKSAFELIYKELRKMSLKFKEIFNEEWLKKHLRLKESGIYEIRCTIDKVAISGSGKTLDRAAANFIQKLSSLNQSKKKKSIEQKKILFNDFAEKWFELVKKPIVKPTTYEKYCNIYSVHIKPFFTKKYIAEITAMQIQPFFTKLNNLQKHKIAKDAYLLLNQIFQSALGERLIPINPMNEVKLLKYKSKKGTPLSYVEEFNFINAIEEHVYKLSFVLLLYVGMRRGELPSARMGNGFIIVKNGKQRLNQEETERKIPITPMLAKYLQGVTKAMFKKALNITPDVLSRAFKKVCPDHHLHELRHTFITRCQECGVPREVVSVWAGHAADKTMTSNVYTKFSDEFMLSEGKKVDYNNRLKD